MIKLTLICLTAFVMNACTASTSSAGNVHVLGRHIKSELVLNAADVIDQAAVSNSYEMGWPGSGLVFRMEGKSAIIAIKDGGQGIMDVVVNGVEHTLDLEAGTHIYKLVESGTRDVFDVRVTRRTEVFDTGLFTIGDVVLLNDPEEAPSKFLPMALPSRKILFFGDSITAGFGVRGKTKDCPYLPKTNAPYMAYAGLSAKHLKAEAHFIAISGRGVVRNWDDNPQPVMPEQIDFSLPDHGALGVWDHSQFIPDVIVVALGTNDWFINPGAEKFRQGYLNMLLKFRVLFPESHIVTVSGPLLTGQSAISAKAGIDWALNELKDPNISTLNVSLSESGLKWSCSSHPGQDSMKKMATELSAHIGHIIGWDYSSIK